jgi:hypothetical protein
MSLSPEKFEQICQELSICGDNIVVVCKRLNSNHQTFYEYLNEDKPGKNETIERYARAREQYNEIRLARRDEINEKCRRDILKCDPKIANAIVSQAREECRQIEWELSKVLPKKYGERLNVDQDTNLHITMQDDKGKTLDV